MAILNPQKTVMPSEINCDGEATVKISFCAMGEIVCHPADIVLVMDRSSSLYGRISHAQKGANTLIDMLSDTGGDRLTQGSKMALVSFSSQATVDVPFTDDTHRLKEGISRLTPCGGTNQEMAFNLAQSLFSAESINRKIIVLFTDGKYNEGADPENAAKAARNSGIEIFCIGFSNIQKEFARWASIPLESHIATAAAPDELEDMFKQIGTSVVIPGARNIKIIEKVMPDFEISRIGEVSAGKVRITGLRTLEWTLDSALGETYLTFSIRHIGRTEGIKLVNESLLYTDCSGHTPAFPNPVLKINCEPGIYPEPCPIPGTVETQGCQDSVIVDAPETTLLSLGRIIQVNAVIKNVCPGKRVAAALILTETDGCGNEYDRGMKTVVIPPQTGKVCQDVQIRCVRFVVPESLDPSGNTQSICNTRTFHVRVLANYLDTDFICCSASTDDICSDAIAVSVTETSCCMEENSL